MLKRKSGLDFNLLMLLIAIAACVVAGWLRLISHQLWQDIVIMLGNGVIALFGLLLASNWRGTTERYSTPAPRLSPKRPHHSQQVVILRISGVALALQALIAMISNSFWIFVLLFYPK